MKDHLYAPLRRYRTIEIIHDALVKSGKIKPSRQRRFLNPKEAQKLKTKWHECKHVNKFLALAKLQRCNFFNYQYFMEVYEEDPACGVTIQNHIIQETRCCVHGVRELLREKEMSFGIQWPEHASVLSPKGLDKLVLVYMELSKISNRPGGSIDDDECDMYWLLMRRFYPADKQRAQAIIYPDGQQGRLDAWVDFLSVFKYMNM